MRFKISPGAELGKPSKPAGKQPEGSATYLAPSEGGNRAREKARGPKDIILNPVKQLKRLFGPKEPTKDHSRKLTKATGKLNAPQGDSPIARDSGSSASAPSALLQPASGKLYKAAHRTSEPDSKSGSSAAAAGCLGGGVVRPAVARKVAEAGSKAGLAEYEREADRLKDAVIKGADAGKAPFAKGSSPAHASSIKDPARQTNADGGGDPMKEALAFYEREADMLKDRVLASRQGLPPFIES